MTGEKKISGVVKGSASIAYSFEIPCLRDEESRAYLVTLAKNYLKFLEKESKKPCDFVRFGGLRFERKENALVLLAAFCPFSQRDFKAKTRLFLDEEEKLYDIKTEKRSRRNSP